jgi:hypothetical protein
MPELPDLAVHAGAPFRGTVSGDRPGTFEAFEQRRSGRCPGNPTGRGSVDEP